MCLNPITIVNPSKYVSVIRKQRFLLQVPCGHCYECATNKSNAILYRLYHQMHSCLENSQSFVYFDCLTYRNQDLPRLSDHIDVGLTFNVFRHKDLRNFLERLRQRVKRKYHSNFTYFVASEYGTRDGCSHRTHYHPLFFVVGPITNLQFSCEVSDCWCYGRTDGIPYRSSHYVEAHNTIRDIISPSGNRVVSYVSKYVIKSSLFQKEVEKRLNYAMSEIGDRMKPFVGESWQYSFNAKLVREKLQRLMYERAFYSKEFGASAMYDMDFLSMVDRPVVSIPHYKYVKLSLPLPMYYKRKAFFDVVELHGVKTWIPNDLGVAYYLEREKQLFKTTESRLRNIALDSNIQVDSVSLANYIVDRRGRIHSLIDDDYKARFFNPTHYVYVTRYDRDYIGECRVYSHYKGCSTNCNYVDMDDRHWKLWQFIERFVQLDETFESQLKMLYDSKREYRRRRQALIPLQQRMKCVRRQLENTIVL